MPKNITLPYLSERTIEWILSYVDIGLPGACWIWTGKVERDGYARISIANKNFRVHRLVYRIFTGTDPAHLCCLHRCDVPLCANPSHLFLGTVADNIRDRDLKDRTRRLRIGDHCKAGHLLTKETLMRVAVGGKWQAARCRICYNAYMRPYLAEYRLKKREELRLQSS